MADIIISKQDASQVLRLAFDDSTQSLRVQGSAIPGSMTVDQADGSLLHTTVDASALPTGASTEVKQDVGNTSLDSIDTKTPALVTGRVPVDGSAVTQPVSAASLPLPAGAATSANQTTANASLSSIDTKLTSPLTVTGPLTDTELRATAVPVSGTVTVSNPGLTDTQLRATPVPVSGTVTTGGLTDTELRATPVPISGTVTANTGLSQPLTDTQLRATAVPVSGTVAVSNPGLTDAELRATAVPVSLTSTTITGSVAVTGPLTDTQLRATPVPVSGTVSTGGLTDTELRATPVPVSGTVTANAGSGTFAVSAASLPLPTGAATEATLSTLNGKVTAVDTGAVTISTALPSGTNNIGDVDVASLPVAFNAGAASATTQRVVIVTDQTSIPVAATLSAETTKVIGTVNIASGQTVANVTTVGTITNAVPIQSPNGYTKAHAPVYNAYASTSVTTAAYVEMVASTSAAIKQLQIFDSSGQALYLATGAAASEVDQIIIPPGGGVFDLAIAASTRISLKAVTGTANTGYITFTFLG